MPQLKFPQGKDATIVDDEGRIWRIKDPKGDRSVAPKGREFYQKADGTLGMRRLAKTEFERLRLRLPPEARASADSVQAQLKLSAKDAAIAGRAAGGAGALSQIVRLPATPGAADTLDIKVDTPAAVKTLDELQEKRANRDLRKDSARNKVLNDREDRILNLISTLGETKLHELTGEVVPKYGADHVKVLEGLLNTEYLEYQRELGTAGIAIQGGRGFPGTKSNPYKPTSRAQMELLSVGDYFLDPDGVLWRWEGKGVKQDKRPTKPEPAPKPRQRKPPVKPIVAGGSLKKPSRSETERPQRSEAELRRWIKQITARLDGDVTGKPRIKLINRKLELEIQLENLIR